MNGFARTLQAELDTVPVVDPHSHLRPAKPEADTLADIVLYHHIWIELVSAGMPATGATRAGLPHELVDPEMEPLDRVNAVVPYLPHIRNTTCGSFLRTLLQDLYDVPGGDLTADNLEDVFSRVAERSADPAWRTELLGNRCHITKSITCERYQEPACGDIIGKGAEGVPANLESGKTNPQQALAGIESQLGKELKSADDYGEAMRNYGKQRSNMDVHFVGMWVLPFTTFIQPSNAEVTQVLQDTRAGMPISHEQMSAFWSYGVRHFLEGMREGPVRTIQFIVGAEVLPPHRSITHWSPELPGALARLAGEFEDFHFNCSSACDANIQDLGIIAKHVPNVSVAGYWWHVLYPFYIRKSIETRLDMVPANKIIAFFSDAYHAEWIYPKLRLVKQIFGEVLVDRVERGLLTEDIALSLVHQCFYENPKRIYNVAD